MEIFLFAIIVLQLGYTIYIDIQNRAEREKLTTKLMAKDLAEYKSVMEEAPESGESEDTDPYISIEEAGVDRVVKAKEKE